MTIDPKRLYEARRKAKKRCPKRYFEHIDPKGQVDEESWDHCCKRRRDVTSPCSNPNCTCRNPRKWAKGKEKLTNQERKAKERDRD